MLSGGSGLLCSELSGEEGILERHDRSEGGEESGLEERVRSVMAGAGRCRRAREGAARVTGRGSGGVIGATIAS